MGRGIHLFEYLLVMIIPIANAVIYYHIQEERSPTVLGNLADDANITNTGNTLSFEFLVGNSQHPEKFNIDEKSGTLSTAQTLDREALCPFSKVCEIRLTVAAVGISSLTKIEVRVVVEDINDNKPVFNPSSMTLEISEGSVIGSNFPIIAATDEDMVGNNSLQGYQITTYMEYFRLVLSDEKPDGTKDVSLQLIKALDRESKEYFQIYVVAMDGGKPPLNGMLTIDIIVTDINDNRPEFVQPQYEITVDENIPVGSEIITVKAKDADVGVNAEIVYSFSDRVGGNSKDYFQIDAKTGNITLKKQLEYAMETSYRLIVTAEDKGTQPNSNQAVVLVSVKDTNNNIPQINFNLLTGDHMTEIEENAAIDKVVAHIQAVDKDKGENGEVNCTLAGNPSSEGLFRMKAIGPNEFMVVVNGLIDRETQVEYIVTVFCEDGGTPSLNNTDSFQVIVLDQNDNKPEFQRKIIRESLQENSPPPKLITKVSAMDPDQDSEITYKLEDSAKGLFSIDGKSGIINAVTEFNREDVDFYSFLVYAIDNGSNQRFTGTCTVQVTITDDNDLEPKFTKDAFEFYVPENSILAFGNVTATDDDLGENGRITYFIHQIYSSMPFVMTKQGELSTLRELDREKRDFYELAVIARDNGPNMKQSDARVIVHVQDINDNPPIIHFPNETDNYVNISYKAKPNTVVTTITATDDDIGQNAVLNYVIVKGNEDGLFQMDYRTGDVVLVREIKLHEIKTYPLFFAVEDNGNPQKSVQQSLNIQVLFVNSSLLVDHDPVMNNNNILIVIAIGCVTIILSTVIIIMICIIRKIDTKKRNYNSKSAEEMKIIEMARSASNRSSSSKGSRDGFIVTNGDRAPKKEVSFSVDDEHDSAFTFAVPPSVSGSQLMTFKSGNNTLEDPQNKQLERPGAMVNHIRENSDSRQKQVHRMASLRVQQQLLQQQNRPPYNDKNKTQQKTHDDNRSDMSEESTTSDSGRGGSEEDIRHAMPPAPPQELDVSRNFSMGDSSGASTLSQASCASTRPLFKTFGHTDNKNNSGMSTFPLQIVPNSRQISLVNRPMSSSPRARTPSGSSSPYHRSLLDLPYAGQSRRDSGENRHLPKNNRTQFQTFDDSISESCATTNREDDDATTTSGSYTVNAEELCCEIDDMFFKSDTVV